MSLPSNWASCTLENLLASSSGSLVDGPFGSALKSSDYTTKGCRVIRLNNIGVLRFNDADKAFIDLGRYSHLSRHEARPGDLLTAALGDPLGRTCIVPDGLGPAIVKADCFRSRLHPRINSDLIAFWLNSPTLARYFSENGKGVGRIRITLSTLRNAPLPLPPELEQESLASRVRIVLERTRKAKLEAEQALTAAQALRISGLRAGVTGKLTARWRETAKTKIPVEELLNETPPPVQSSSGRRATDTKMLGIAAIAVNEPSLPLPSGWRWVPLQRVARLETGHTPSRQNPEYWDGDIDWLSIRDARKHHGGVVDHTSQKVTQAGIDASAARVLPAQTVCLSRTASVGYVTILGRPMATSQDFVTWSCTPALQPEYLMYALMAEGKGIRRFGRGSTHTTIYFPELRAFHIALPPREEQTVVANRIRRLLDRADALATEARRASSIADELGSRTIEHAMSGAYSKRTTAMLPAETLLSSIANERKSAPTKPRRSSPAATHGFLVGVSAIPREPFMTASELTSAIIKAGGSMRTDILWKQSGLPIDRFYRLLREEFMAGRIRESADKETLLAN